ncbi:MAG: anthranilate synthase component [Candidatus Eremiobacteraeota bacterium]|jgi:anthranilate synthase component 1|nr:anthranilate synthase component [Candidatus Eremiobacteraeota bacterium]
MLVATADEPLSLTSITRSFVADSITPISAYLALAQPGRSCLLESVEGTERISRFSFVGLDYLETFAIDRDPLMLEKIRAAVGRYRLDRTDLPFPGGAVCVFTYDAARALEPVLRDARDDAPPADVRFGDALVVVPGTWLVFDHFTHRVTLIGFARGEQERDAVDARLDAYVARLLDQRPTVPGAVRADGDVGASMDEQTFLDRVAQAKRFIFDGDAYQLQVGIRFSCALAGTAFDFYRQIRARNPSPYMFFVEHDGRAVFGASPEFLVRLDGRTARIRPLAGTRPRDADPEADQRVADELLADEKERAEHVMLVDLARNDLGAVCRTGTVRVDELMVIERYSHVMHIVSNVVGELREDKDALDLFAASFPAGTVTGTPKIRAMQLIDRLEPVARGFYAGSVAHIDFDGDLDSCIILRSVAVANGRAYWQASAGIVADSVPATEYAEVFAKTGIVRSVLGIDA